MIRPTIIEAWAIAGGFLDDPIKRRNIVDMLIAILYRDDDILVKKMVANSLVNYFPFENFDLRCNTIITNESIKVFKS